MAMVCYTNVCVCVRVHACVCVCVRVHACVWTHFSCLVYLLCQVGLIFLSMLYLLLHLVRPCPPVLSSYNLIKLLLTQEVGGGRNRKYPIHSDQSTYIVQYRTNTGVHVYFLNTCVLIILKG